MTETMFDRLTAAIGTHLYGFVHPEGTPNTWATSRDTARAALEAIREPTSEVVSAGYPAFADPCWPEDAARGYTAMIDAILSQSQEGPQPNSPASR